MVYCILCNSLDLYKYFYPSNVFNEKTFNYYKCRNCKAVSIAPIPNEEDFDKMYGLNDYKDLLEIGVSYTDYKKYSKYHHRKYQLDFLKADQESLGLSGRLLDFGCGTGFYMDFAEKLGFEAIGVEFDLKFAQNRRDKTKKKIFAKEEFEEYYNNQKFDVIHIGHVLEHLPDPTGTLNFLKKYLKKNGVFLIDGPLEINTTLTNFFIRTISSIKNKRENYYVPQHLWFTDYNSQLNYFNNQGLETISYIASETPFPLPDKIDLRKPSTFLLYPLSQTSIAISKNIKSFGNIFHYVGKIQ